VNRILGLDTGERRIGVAISDPDRRFALPLRSIDASGGEEAIARIIEAEEVTEIVVGLPLSLSGEASAQTERARAFGRRLEERLGLPVQFWDERLSTQEAMRLGGSDRSRRGRERPPPPGSHGYRLGCGLRDFAGLLGPHAFRTGQLILLS
jgi:putative Holliday junction resolvase